MAGKQKQARRSSTTLGDKLEELKDVINTNHVATVERIATLEASLKELPERVRKLEAARNWLGGCIALTVTALTIWAGIKH